MAEEMSDANAELIAFVESCTDEEWRTICRAERWGVGVVAHHVAWGTNAPPIGSMRSAVGFRSPEARRRTTPATRSRLYRWPASAATKSCFSRAETSSGWSPSCAL